MKITHLTCRLLGVLLTAQFIPAIIFCLEGPEVIDIGEHRPDGTSVLGCDRNDRLSAAATFGQAHGPTAQAVGLVLCGGEH